MSRMYEVSLFIYLFYHSLVYSTTWRNKVNEFAEIMTKLVSSHQSKLISLIFLYSNQYHHFAYNSHGNKNECKLYVP